jgi:hypothetical protein
MMVAFDAMLSSSGGIRGYSPTTKNPAILGIMLPLPKTFDTSGKSLAYVQGRKN